MPTSRPAASARRVRSVSAARSSSSAADSPEARALLDALRAVSRELRRVERQPDAQLGLQPAQLNALRELAARRAGSLAELAVRTHTDPSSASVVVQRLVDRGLVVRKEAAEDRRRTELMVTPAGRSLAARAPTSAVARVAGALSPMGDRQAASLASGLRTLARSLREANDESLTDEG